MLNLRSSLRPIAALALLGVLWLGAASHHWHHLADHACETTTAGTSQPCATCVAFHAGTIISDPQAGAVGRPIAVALVALIESDSPHATPVANGAPRGPPAA